MGDAPVRRARGQAGLATGFALAIFAILFLVAAGMAYLSSSTAETYQRERDSEKVAREELDARFNELSEQFRQLSEALGYRDASNVLSRSDVAALRSDVDSALAQLGRAAGEGEAAAPSGQTLENAVAALKGAHRAALDAQAAAEAAVATERQGHQSALASVSEIESRYTERVAELQQQLEDSNKRADNQAQSDQTRFDELLASESAADTRARDAEQALAEAEVAGRRQLATAEAQLKAVSARTKEVVPEAVDGEVLAVGRDGATAFIDIGGRDGLQRGTRFEVLRRSKSGELMPRGTVEVREVESDMAMVGLVGEPDPFDPMLSGDVLRNPSFDRNQSMNVVLLGDFPVSLSRDFVSARLADQGATVEEKVSTSTDLLVLGFKPMADELAPELTETPEYQLADKLGVRIVRIDDLAPFLRY